MEHKGKSIKTIYDYTLDELKDNIKPSFRAKQIYQWVYKKYTTLYKDMENLPKELLVSIEKDYPIKVLKIIKKDVSVDGTIKYLFELNDKTTIESVLLLMKNKKRNDAGDIIKSEKYTFCVSSQVGCKIGCSFCLTAKGGFTRNLTAGEIVAQMVYLKKDNEIDENKSVNIVYMGMGEPMDNYNNLIKAIRIISQKESLYIVPKRQTLSTSGISSKIDKLTEENLDVNLAISLHAVDDELRDELIPINKAYDIESVLTSAKRFSIKMNSKILIEYLVIKDKNDSLEAASKLVKLLSNMNAKVNLIYFNPYDGALYEKPSRNKMIAFQKYILSKNLLCTIRESKGEDILAACGQLKEKIFTSTP